MKIRKTISAIATMTALFVLMPVLIAAFGAIPVWAMINFCRTIEGMFFSQLELFASNPVTLTEVFGINWMMAQFGILIEGGMSIVEYYKEFIKSDKHKTLIP